MKFQKSFQRLALAAILCSFIAVSFSSCYRSSGCPGQITYQPIKYNTGIEGEC